MNFKLYARVSARFNTLYVLINFNRFTCNRRYEKFTQSAKFPSDFGNLIEMDI